jgi:hypothetical protein
LWRADIEIASGGDEGECGDEENDGVCDLHCVVFSGSVENFRACFKLLWGLTADRMVVEESRGSV